MYNTRSICKGQKCFNLKKFHSKQYHKQIYTYIFITAKLFFPVAEKTNSHIFLYFHADGIKRWMPGLSITVSPDLLRRNKFAFSSTNGTDFRPNFHRKSATRTKDCERRRGSARLVAVSPTKNKVEKYKSREGRRAGGERGPSGR